MNWEAYVKTTIRSFRERFEHIDPGLKVLIQQDVYSETLLEPCQVEVSDPGEHWYVIWLITHDQQRKDMEVTVYNNIKNPQAYAKAYFEAKQHLFENYEKGSKESLLSLLKEGGTLHLYPNDYYWVRKNLRKESSYSHAADLVGITHTFLEGAVDRIHHRELEESAKALKKDIALVDKEELRSRLEENSRRIDQTIQQIRRIEQHERKLRSMEDNLMGVRKLVGTKGFGEWKVLLSEIDKINTRIDALSDVKSAYDKVLVQQNEFMKQQSEVMKQQSSFMNWIKYSAIFVPIAIACIPIIETLIRHFLG